MKALAVFKELFQQEPNIDSKFKEAVCENLNKIIEKRGRAD